MTRKQRETEGGIPLAVTEFHLLSSRSYIFACASFEGGYEAGEIGIFTFEGDCTNSPILIANLELPDLNPGIYITNMIIQAGPFCANPISGTPFSKSNDNRIYMILLCYGTENWCRLFVHRRCFHSYVLDVDHVREKTGVTAVPWREWGPQNSRLLPGQNHQWNRHVHGERVVLPCVNRKIVQVLDFGIVPARADSDTVPVTSTVFSTELHLEPGPPWLDGIFRDTWTTALPYKSTLRALDEEYDLFLMDQDRIIGLRTSEFDPSHRMTVYTF
ncbi:F-box domain-containing protein [Mycena venus]|uniref:F-box domain-containing protein n=1 Tax=Mycena venus TaxID=2733690 RepID=A0A8H7D1Z3_9AGAR|nr:F-box domain-containing protein [Mycena venus]